MQPVANTFVGVSAATMLQRLGRGALSLLKPLGSLLPSHRGAAAASGRIMRPWRDDSFHAYPTVGLTPSRALSFVQQADGGSPQMQFELFSEMLQKWPRLAAVENTRPLALTGLDWENLIEPYINALALTFVPVGGILDWLFD